MGIMKVSVKYTFSPVYERAMPAMRGGGIHVRCWLRRAPIAGASRSYTGLKGDFHANGHDARTSHRGMKNRSRRVGAGFKPALRREIGSIRHGSALGGFETRYKTVLCRYVCDVFHANFHDAYRHTPNDEKSAAWVGRIRPPGRHPPVHPLESKPCRAPSAIANNRRMALRLSALRSVLRCWRR